MKIDAFCHIMPRPYYDRFFRLDATEHSANLRKRVSRATIRNLEETGLSGEEREAVFSGNVIRLTGLTVRG